MAYETAPDITAFEETLAERLNETLFNDYGIPLDAFVVRATGDGEFDLELEQDIEEIKDQLPTKITFGE